MTDDDLEQLRAWQAGDAAAGRSLVARHYAAIYRFFFAQAGANACEDLTQATFEVLCRRRDAFRGEGSFKGFLYGIARMKLLEHIRGRLRLGPSFDPAEHSVIDPDTAASIASLLADRQLEHLVAEALRSLPLDDQILLELKEHEQLTARELAQLFAVPPGTIAGRIARARQRLRDAVDRLIADPAQRAGAERDLESCMRSIAQKIDHHLRSPRRPP